MINEIRQEINLSPDLEKKINWAVKYASIKVKVHMMVNTCTIIVNFVDTI